MRVKTQGQMKKLWNGAVTLAALMGATALTACGTQSGSRSSLPAGVTSPGVGNFAPGGCVPINGLNGVSGVGSPISFTVDGAYHSASNIVGGMLPPTDPWQQKPQGTVRMGFGNVGNVTGGAGFLGSYQGFSPLDGTLQLSVWAQNNLVNGVNNFNNGFNNNFNNGFIQSTPYRRITGTLNLGQTAISDLYASMGILPFQQQFPFQGNVPFNGVPGTVPNFNPGQMANICISSIGFNMGQSYNRAYGSFYVYVNQNSVTPLQLVFPAY